ncbi:S26 family signal peptidase [Paenibacillus mucilaginosus]|uniref:S26 family signal peptidase n=1 Tax=Paenibacillus mucilaginosus TaxID=61624 RepID=UPI003D24542D
MSQEEITLGADQYFVIGDNYQNSFDSRSGLGLVEEETVRGKVIYVEHVEQNS